MEVRLTRSLATAQRSYRANEIIPFSPWMQQWLDAGVVVEHKMQVPEEVKRPDAGDGTGESGRSESVPEKPRKRGRPRKRTGA